MSIITIKEENYLIYDYNHGEFHTRPEIRVNDEDYKRIIDNIKEFNDDKQSFTLARGYCRFLLAFGTVESGARPIRRRQHFSGGIDRR